MPIVSIDAPSGLSRPKKTLLMQRINAALSDAYEITENLIFLREYPSDNVAFAGVLRSDESSTATAPSAQTESLPVSA
jgi:hypothetical protein